MKYPIDSAESITSLKNERVKNFLRLQKTRERKKQDLFIIEGFRETQRALDSGMILRQVYHCPEIHDKKQLDSLVGQLDPTCLVFTVSRDVYNHMVYRKDTEGVAALAVPSNHNLKDLVLGKDPLLLILEDVEKPGNLGAVLRTADAAGLDAVIVCDQKTDVYNPNVIRSSLGAVFTVPVGIATSKETIQWLRRKKIAIYCTALTASRSYVDVDYRKASAIVMGTEARGLSELWLRHSEQNIIIPMKGKVDSMNVSVSAGIMIYEAVRQRG